MRTVWLVLAGIAGGVMGGMGLGGGMLLIPIMTFLFDVSPKLAAWINLVVFLPMGLVALVFHAKNHFVDLKAALFLLVFSVFGAGMVFWLGKGLSEVFLRRAFGWFLLVTGCLSIISVLCGFSKQKQ